MALNPPQLTRGSGGGSILRSPTGVQSKALATSNFLQLLDGLWLDLSLDSNFGKTTKSNCHPNPTTNPNPNPYLVAVRYGSLAVAYKAVVWRVYFSD